MNLFIKRFIWRLLSRPIVRAVDWTVEERNQFELFCRSTCGIKLFEFLRQVVASQTFNAVYRNSVSANSEARGAQNLLATLHKLRVFPDSGEQEQLSDEPTRQLPVDITESIDGRRFGLGSGSAIGRR
jgi:hypothetical protein